MITQDLLKELFEYDPDTGVFINRYTRGPAREGHEAGSYSCGYWRLSVSQERLYAHQAAFLYMTGELPEEVDHIDGNRCNNSWINLRAVTRSQNNGNAYQTGLGVSGMRGVYLEKRTGSWFSKIQYQGRQIHIGTFGTREEAEQAYINKHIELFGEHSFYLNRA